MRLTLTNTVVVSGLLGFVLLGCTSGSSGSGSSGVAALRGRYLPGTTRSSWSALTDFPNPPAGVRERLYARSKNGSFNVFLFDFQARALASTLYEHPPQGFVPLSGPTGMPSPSRGLALVGPCGSATCPLGAGVMLRRADVVILVWWVSHTPLEDSTRADREKVYPYANDCLKLLSSVGLPS